MSRSWSGKSYGGGIGHRLLIWIARRGGRHVVYLALWVPVAWILVRDHAARIAIRDYWRRRQQHLDRLQLYWRCAFHFHSFGRILVDRVLIHLDPDALRHRHYGADRLEQAMQHPHGCIVLSAHVGNWELASHFLTFRKTTVMNMILLEDEDPQVREALARAMGEQPFNIIPLTDPLATSIAIAAALRRGESCALLGDRSVGAASNCVRVPFLGAEAAFPAGPFIAAMTTGALIVPTFTIKIGLDRYLVFADEPMRVPAVPRAQRQEALQQAVRRWAGRIEQVLDRVPYQWHNFYDFWAPPR